MSAVDRLEERVRHLEIELRALASFAIQVKALSDAHEMLGAEQVHGGKNAGDFPTHEQLAAMADAAAEHLQKTRERTAMMSDDGPVM